MAVSFSLSHAGLEVYTTTTNKGDTIKLSSDTSDASSNFLLQNGEITQIDYIGELYSDTFESDYLDISSNASITLPMDYYSNLFKGKRVSLKKGTADKWENLDTAVLGFITELSYSKDKIDVKINGMDKLLDQEKKFSFKKTKMSKIIKKIITSSGLKAKVNTTGLTDHVITFTNVSSSSKSSGSGTNSELKGGEGETIDNLVKKIVGSETDELKKAKAIHAWLKKEVKYKGYECTRYNTPEKCYQNRKHLNCADTARLTRAMMSSAGLDAWVVHRASNNGHFWTLIKINGKIYASDQTGSGSAWNTIWYKDGDRRDCNSRGGNWDRKNGKNPDC